MNTKLIVWIVGIFLGAIVLGTIWYFLATPTSAPQQPTQQSSTTLPVSGSVFPASTTTQSSGTIALPTADGSATVTTADFIHNGTTIPDKANAGQYLLAGNLGYCPSNPQQCQAAPANDFTVYYNSSQHSFTVALTQEPIGQARLDAQQFLLAALGISAQQICSLNYYVGTTYWVNSRYDDRNLGFSFCPGATALPQ